MAEDGGSASGQAVPVLRHFSSLQFFSGVSP